MSSGGSGEAKCAGSGVDSGMSTREQMHGVDPNNEDCNLDKRLPAEGTVNRQTLFNNKKTIAEHDVEMEKYEGELLDHLGMHFKVGNHV